MKKILLVIAAISVLTLAGCKSDENVNNDVPQDEVNQEQEVVDNKETDNNEDEKEEANLVDKLDDSKDWVYDAEYEKNVIADSYITEFSEICTPENIVVPFINIDSVETKACNEEIKKVFEEAIEMYNSGVNDKLTYVDQCSYEKYINNDVLSIVLTTGYGATDVVYPNYYTYNIDLKTGNKLTYEEIYSLAGFNSNTITSKVESAITNIMKERMSTLSAENYPTGTTFDTYNNESIKNYETSIIENSLKYFLSDDGKLNVIVKLNIPAGREEFNTIITID